MDADFAADVLADLYRYRRKRRVVAWALWATLGWFGAHRFYLGRTGTGLLMLFTVGGGLFWWLVDAFFIRSMVGAFNAEQEQRERSGLPPMELDFMPPMVPAALERPPEWTEQWRAGSRRKRVLRFGGDLLVLLVSGFALGAVASGAGVYEAVVAILVLAGLTAMGAAVGPLDRLPVLRGLVAWSHRLRLFYYYNKPGTPLGLLFRPVAGAFLAPFRRRDRAEVKLYLQLGAVFTVAFMVEDLISEWLEAGGLGLWDLVGFWIGEASLTFVVIYAFATPIGAVLTLYLLVRPTHTVPRLLSAVVVAAILLGALV